VKETQALQKTLETPPTADNVNECSDVTDRPR
jgi:hypothetical protein